jgi:hypothetical protein
MKAVREAEFAKLSSKGALEMVRRLDGHNAKQQEIITDGEKLG